MTNPVFCAIDTTDPAQALDLARRLGPLVGGVKLGLEFFTANGPQGIRQIAALDMPVFLDLKFHDIPNTVAGAIRGIAPLAPALTTIHAAGGLAMMKAAVDAAGDAAARLGTSRPKILGVTMLTSTGEADLDTIGVKGPMTDQVLRLATLAQEAGLDGVIASPHEIAPLRAACDSGFLLVIPGIRPGWSENHDQKRVLTPAEALARGADRLVIGRPITAAEDPVAAARRILAELRIRA